MSGFLAVYINPVYARIRLVYEHTTLQSRRVILLKVLGGLGTLIVCVNCML